MPQPVRRARSVKGVFRNRRDHSRYAPTDDFVGTAPAVVSTDYYTDLFERSVSSGTTYGTADLGGAYTAYTTTTGTAVTVSSGAGRITAATTPKTFHQSVDGIGNKTDCAIWALVSFSAVPTGANCELSIYARSDVGAGSYYAADLAIETTGVMNLSIEKNTTGARTDIEAPINVGTYTANTKYWVELLISGTNLEARIWLDGTGRPSSATLSGTDSSYSTGVMGLRSRWASGNTNIPEIAFWEAHGAPGLTTGTVLTDTGTPAQLLTASAVETREIGDTGTAAQLLTHSGTDSREFPAETATSTLVLTHSGTDTRESLDTNTPFARLTTSATETREALDTSTPTQLLTHTGTDTREFPADTFTGLHKLTPSVTEQVLREYPDTATVAQLLTVTGTDTRESVDTSTPAQLLTVTYAELREFTDTTSVSALKLTPSATELKEIPDAATVALLLTATAVELRESLDANTVAQLLQITSTLAQVWADTAQVNQLLTASAVEIRESVDTATTPLLLTHSGVDLYTTPGETATCLSVLTPSVTELVLHAYPDTNTVAQLLVTSATDTFQAVDVNTATQLLQASAAETRDILDTSTLNLQLTHSGTDLLIPSDTSTVLARLTTSALEIAPTTYADTAVAAVTIAPSAVDITLGAGETATCLLKLSPAITVELMAEFIIDDYFVRGSPLYPSTTLIPSAGSSSNWITAMLETGNLTGVMLGMGPSVTPDHVGIAENYVGNVRDFFWSCTIGSLNSAFNPTGKNASNVQTDTPVPWQTDVIDEMNGTYGGSVKHTVEIVPNVLGNRNSDGTWPTNHNDFVNWTYGDNSYIDTCVTAWADLMKSVPRQTMFRLWHEHGNAVTTYGMGTDAQFVYRWQKVFTRWGELGCFTTNVLTSKCLIAWCPAASALSPGDDLTQFPGTDYVHVIGRDIYCHVVDGSHPASTFNAANNLKQAAQQWYDSYHPSYGPNNTHHRPLVVFEGGVEVIDGERIAKTQQYYNRLSGVYTDNGQPPIIGGAPNPAHDGPWDGISAMLWWDGGGNDLNNTPAGFQSAYTTATNQANLLPNGYAATTVGSLYPGSYVASSTPSTTFGVSKDNLGQDGASWYAPYGLQNLFSVDLDNPGGKIETIPELNTTGNHIPVGVQDQNAYMKFKIAALPVAGNWNIELVTRAVNIDNSYRLVAVVKQGGAADLILRRFVNGVNVNLATHTGYIPSWQLGSYYELEVIATDRIFQYRAWRTGDAAPAFNTFTDATATPVLGPGDSGVRIRNTSGAGTLSSILFDRFYVKSRIEVAIGDTGTAAVRLDPVQSTDVVTKGDDTATVLHKLTATGTTFTIAVDTSTVPLVLAHTGTEVPAYADSTTVPLVVAPTVFEETTGLELDSGIVLFKATPSATFVATYGDTVSVAFARLTASGIEIQLYSETTTVHVVLLVPSAVIQLISVDTGTVELLLRPSVQFVQFILDHLLEGTIAGKWLAQLETERYTGVIEPVRWSAAEVRRWHFTFRGRGKIQ